MKRREFISLIGGAVAAWPLAVRAQQADRVRRIGVLMTLAENDPLAQSLLTAFQQELHRTGWIEGHNILIDYRWALSDPQRMRVYAAELVGSTPDVIVAMSNQATAIVSQQTTAIPIVFAGVGDPLETGLVSSLARPGGNITGFNSFESSIGGKWLGLLKEVAPYLTHAAVLYTPGGPSSVAILRLVDLAAPTFGVQTTTVPASDPAEIERAVNAVSREANGGLIILTGPATFNNREQIIALAARYRLPAIYPNRIFVDGGGLMSYAAVTAESFKGAASYIDRILRGAKPGDLPVQQPTEYQLVINLKTAKALGLDVPASLLARADEVIE